MTRVQHREPSALSVEASKVAKQEIKGWQHRLLWRAQVVGPPAARARGGGGRGGVGGGGGGGAPRAGERWGEPLRAGPGAAGDAPGPAPARVHEM
jgi:hypothetical protein